MIVHVYLEPAAPADAGSGEWRILPPEEVETIVEELLSEAMRLDAHDGKKSMAHAGRLRVIAAKLKGAGC